MNLASNFQKCLYLLVCKALFVFCLENLLNLVHIIFIKKGYVYN